MNDKAKALMNYMSDLSQSAFCAGWMQGLEYALWRAVVEGPRKYGQIMVENEHITKLEELANNCGGWIIFHDETEETFVPLDQWLVIYAQNTAKSV